MLRNVLADYLDRLKSERDFDLAIATLLPAMGFYDVHFTHGTAEFGKDFIAKRSDGGAIVQYSFQSKKGDIGQADWRNNVLGQMLEAIITTISHPSFDTTLPHQSVLVLTGRLAPNAAVGFQNLNDKIRDTYKKLPIDMWDQEGLIERFTKFGFEGVYTTTASNLITYGQFFVKYGEAMSSQLSDRKIEQWSRHWCDTNIPTTTRIFISTLEAELLAGTMASQGLLFESISCYFALLRSVEFAIKSSTSADETQYLSDVYRAVSTSIENASLQFIGSVVDGLSTSANGILGIVASSGPGLILKYPIACARIMEIASTLYFLTNDVDEKERTIALIERLIADEPGCVHLVSNRFAVTVVASVLALLNHGNVDLVETFLMKVAVWICDRYEQGAGLADIEADAYAETTQLLAYPFSGIDVRPTHGSFAATAVLDLAAYLGRPQFYLDVLNDFLACNITLPYWQPIDSPGQFLFDAEDVVQYPNVTFREDISGFEDYTYAEHIRHETVSFSTVGQVGPIGHLLAGLLLRDRYFPTVWPSIVALNGPVSSDES